MRDAGATGCASSDTADYEFDDASLQAVITVLLAMQRASWEQALTAQALYAYSPVVELPSLIGLAHDMIARADHLGRLGVLLNEQDLSSLDFCAIGEVLVYLHKETRDTTFLNAARSLVGYIRRTAARSYEGLLEHRDGELWVDAIFMLPPALIACGVSWNQDSLIFEGFQQIEGHMKYLRNKDGLWSQSWDVEGGIIRRAERLATGNGWAIAGLVRVLHLLPDGWESEAAGITVKLMETLRAVLKHQRDDGLFHFVIDNPTSFVETTSSQMIAYAIYKLVSLNLLDRDSEEVAAADRMRIAANAKVDKWGFVRGCVLGRKNGEEDNMNGAGTSAEGQAFYILCQCAWRDALDVKVKTQNRNQEKSE